MASVLAPSAALQQSVPPPLRLSSLSAHPAYAPGASVSPFCASLPLPSPGFVLTVPEPAPAPPLPDPEPVASAALESPTPSARSGGGKYVGGFAGLPRAAAPAAGGAPASAAPKFGRGRAPSGGEVSAIASSPGGGGSGGGGGGGGARAAAGKPVGLAAAGALPEGWTLQRDDEGDTYYFNTTTGESQWERPLPPKTGAGRGGASGSSLSASGQTFQGIKISGPVVKSTLVAAPASAPKVEIETVDTAGDAACGSFEANPFKPQMCKRCRKLQSKH